MWDIHLMSSSVLPFVLHLCHLRGWGDGMPFPAPHCNGGYSSSFGFHVVCTDRRSTASTPAVNSHRQANSSCRVHKLCGHNKQRAGGAGGWTAWWSWLGAIAGGGYNVARGDGA